MSNLIPETDRTIVFGPDGEPYVHMLSMVTDMEGKVAASALRDDVTEEFVSGMEFVLEYLSKQREVLVLEHKMRQA